MRYTDFLAIGFLTTLFACKQAEIQPSVTSEKEYTPGQGWNLIWSDEFDGNQLDATKWNYETGTGANGWGNAELQNYRTENVSVGDGKLTITAKRETFASSSFTSARINTKNKFQFKYGKIVGRIKLPEGKGMWPAFWMLGNAPQVWPACGEIDIMEMKGSDNTTNGNKTTYATCHWLNGASPNAHEYYGQQYTYRSNLSQGFHYYEVEWNASSVIARFDGLQYNEVSITPDETAELRNNNFFIILNIAVGGNFFSPAIANPSNVTASLPQTMQVDWVRVYQQ